MRSAHVPGLLLVAAWSSSPAVGLPRGRGAATPCREGEDARAPAASVAVFVRLQPSRLARRDGFLPHPPKKKKKKCLVLDFCAYFM